MVRSTMTRPELVRDMVDRASRSGFNTILVQVRGRGDAFYESSWEPRAQAIPASQRFDPLAHAVELAHARGIAVHAWVNTHLVWSAPSLPASDLHIVRANPEWLAVPRALAEEMMGVDPRDPAYVDRLRQHAADNSDRVEGLYASPSHPAVKERVLSVWMELASRYDLDGIHFDYVRLPARDYDYSPGSLDRFARWVEPRLTAGTAPPLARADYADPLALAEALPEAWAEFQRSHVTELVRWIYYGVKARRPRMTVSAAVRANRAEARDHHYQDWGAWLEEGILDVAVPMAYTSNGDRFRTMVREVSLVAGRERLWAGLGVYLNEVDGTLSQIDIAREENAAGLVLFSYDWAVGDGYGGSGPTLLQVVARDRFGIR